MLNPTLSQHPSSIHLCSSQGNSLLTSTNVSQSENKMSEWCAFKFWITLTTEPIQKQGKTRKPPSSYEMSFSWLSSVISKQFSLITLRLSCSSSWILIQIRHVDVTILNWSQPQPIICNLFLKAWNVLMLFAFKMPVVMCTGAQPLPKPVEW